MDRQDEAVETALDRLGGMGIGRKGVRRVAAPFDSVELAFDLPFPERREFQSTIRISKTGSPKEFMFRFPAVSADESTEEAVRTRCESVKRAARIPESIYIEVNTDGFGTTWQPHFGIENSHSLTLDAILTALSQLIEAFWNEFDVDELTHERIQ